MAEKIVITHLDLRDPRIDEMLERELAFREAAARLQPVGGLRRFFLSSPFYLALVGALGGFLGWALIEPSYDDAVRLGGAIRRVDPDHALARCERCDTLFPADEVVAGRDDCPRCRQPAVESPVKGSFRLERTTVFVVPGKTRLRDAAGGKAPLRDVSDLAVGDRVAVSASAFEGDDLAVVAMEVRPLAAGEAGPGEPDLKGLARRERYIGFLWFAVVGGLVALMVGGVEGLLSLNASQALKSGLIGGAIGFAGGFGGVLPAGLLYTVAGDLTASLEGAGGGGLEDMHGAALYAQIVGRSLAWGVVGMALGLGRGVAMKSRRLVFHGLIGGAIGGLLGGMAFDPVGKLTAADTGDLSRAVGFTCVGLYVGLCLGLVEQLAKEAWLLLRTGPLQGKQFVVHRSPTTIGGRGHCDIFLFRDPAVQAEHARLTRVGRAYEVEDLGTPSGTFVNGQRVERRILRDGDILTIGSTELEYKSRGS